MALWIIKIPSSSFSGGAECSSMQWVRLKVPLEVKEGVVEIEMHPELIGGGP